MTLPWLPGWKSSVPVHVGNPAATQFQLDIYGEVLDSLHLCEQAGLGDRPWDIAIETRIVDHIEKVWERAGSGHLGIAWSAAAFHAFESDGLGWYRPVPQAARLSPRRAATNSKPCAHACTPRSAAAVSTLARNSFVQCFDGKPCLDASLLMLPLVQFLPIDDPRIAGTIAAIEARTWSRTGWCGAGPAPTARTKGAFIACTCWLADCLAMQGRERRRATYLERVIALANDVGLLSEEWDTRGGRMLGNFPQALSHLALVNTRSGLCGPVLQRGGG